MLTTEARAELTVDWVSVTLPHNTRHSLRPAALESRWEAGAGLHGYTHTQRYMDGSIIARNPDRPEMGIHIIWTGRALAAARDNGMTPYDMLHFYALRGGKFTRIDIAADLRETGHTVDQFVAAYRAKQAITSLQRAHHIENLSERGGTLYMGGKGSKRKLRIYDKGAESGDMSDWIRAEAQLMGDIAQSAVKTLLKARESFLEAISKMIVGIVQWAADSPVARAWAILLGMEGVVIEGGPQSGMKNTAAWLLKTAAPSLARLIVETGGRMGDVFADVLDANIADISERLCRDCPS